MRLSAWALVVTGTLGVLLQAKQQGVIAELLPLIDQMIAQGRYIGDNLRRTVARLAGEDGGDTT